jgi:hypothetical protein
VLPKKGNSASPEHLGYTEMALFDFEESAGAAEGGGDASDNY